MRYMVVCKKDELGEYFLIRDNQFHDYANLLANTFDKAQRICDGMNEDHNKSPEGQRDRLASALKMLLAKWDETHVRLEQQAAIQVAREIVEEIAREIEEDAGK